MPEGVEGEKSSATPVKTFDGFASALGGANLTPADPPEVTGRYGVSENCNLNYAFEAKMLIHMTDGPEKLPPMEKSGIQMEGGFTLSNRDPEGLVIQNREILMSHVRGETVNPGVTQPAGSLAPIYLKKTQDGYGLQEVEGPTSLWAAFGSFPGFTVFFMAIQ